MNQTFSNRTMWQSFVCALVATFTLAVHKAARGYAFRAYVDLVHGSLPDWKARSVSGLIRSGLALLRDTSLHRHWHFWGKSVTWIYAATLIWPRVSTVHLSSVLICRSPPSDESISRSMVWRKLSRWLPSALSLDISTGSCALT